MYPNLFGQEGQRFNRSGSVTGRTLSFLGDLETVSSIKQKFSQLIRGDYNDFECLLNCVEKIRPVVDNFENKCCLLILEQRFEDLKSMKSFQDFFSFYLNEILKYNTQFYDNICLQVLSLNIVGLMKNLDVFVQNVFKDSQNFERIREILYKNLEQSPPMLIYYKFFARILIHFLISSGKYINFNNLGLKRAIEERKLYFLEEILQFEKKGSDLEGCDSYIGILCELFNAKIKTTKISSSQLYSPKKIKPKDSFNKLPEIPKIRKKVLLRFLQIDSICYLIEKQLVCIFCNKTKLLFTSFNCKHYYCKNCLNKVWDDQNNLNTLINLALDNRGHQCFFGSNINKCKQSINVYDIEQFLGRQELRVALNYRSEEISCAYCTGKNIIKLVGSGEGLMFCTACSKPTCLKHRNLLSLCFCFCPTCSSGPLVLSSKFINCQNCGLKNCKKCQKYDPKYKSCECYCRVCLRENIVQGEKKCTDCSNICESCDMEFDINSFFRCENCTRTICRGCKFRDMKDERIRDKRCCQFCFKN